MVSLASSAIDAGIPVDRERFTGPAVIGDPSG